VRELVWDPLESALGSADTILVCGAGPIAMCPLAALPQRDGKSFLVEKFALAHLISPRAITDGRIASPAAGDPSILLVGDVDYGAMAPAARDEVQPFATLPSSESTFEAIGAAARQSFPTPQLEIFTGQQASEDRVRDAVEGRRFVHFDTHGFCVPLSEILAGNNSPAADVLVGGIAVANANRAIVAPDEDGVLWADELTTLDLGDAELVVLLACQSAQGPSVPGEGQLGPHRALSIAGARATLATLWSVEVAPSRELMANFYRNLWVDKLSKAKALQQAQISLLRGDADNSAEGRLPPAQWAGFVLHGDWR
jgi:CHAT domain-containing protein